MNTDERRRQEYEEIGYSVRAFENHIDAVSNERERDYLRSLQTGYLDRNAYPSAPYVPRLVYNDKASSNNVLSSLENEFRRCDRFDVSVAFVTKDGVTVLMNTLLDLKRRGICGRISATAALARITPSFRSTRRTIARVSPPLRSRCCDLCRKSWALANACRICCC